MISIRSIVLSLIACVLSSSVASAGLMLRIEDKVVTPGGHVTVDVFVSSDVGDTITDAFFEFRIVPLGGTPRQLMFSNPQSDQQLSDSSYLFALGSYKRDGDPLLGLPPSAVGDVTSVVTVNDTFSGYDLDPTLAGVSVGSQELLLARLDIESAFGHLAPLDGDQFRIEMEPALHSYFLDLTSSASPFVGFTSTSGTITVSSVPEPASLAMWGFLCLCIAHWKRHRSTRCCWL